MDARARLLLVLLGFPLLCCSLDPTGDHQRVKSLGCPITGGSMESGYPTVGKLFSGAAVCTATLVGHHTVLTAGHCISSGLATFELDGVSYSSTQVVLHPGYGGGNFNDLALVTLSQDVSGVTPASINTTPLMVGQPIKLIGFGLTETSNSFGTKRSGANIISSVGASTFDFWGNSNVCDGDSGGPSFVQENGLELVAGVHSTRADPGCGVGGTDMRVDIFESWLLEVSQGDLSLEGVGLPPGGNDSGTPAREGQSCYSGSCGPGLACTTIFNLDEVVVGKHCMEQCTTVGADPICDGDEQCVESKTAGRVCFDPTRPETGYTNPDTVTSPPVEPPPLDITAPQVSIDSPTPGAAVPAKVSILATVTDEVGVTLVELHVDGSLWSTRKSTPYEFTANLEPGNHVLAVRGYDAAGNMGEAQVPIVVEDTDATPPPGSASDGPSSSEDPSQPERQSEQGQTATPSPGDENGSFGDLCESSTDCQSGMCAQDPAAAETFCTQACDPWTNPCPGGAGCFPSSGAGHVCGAPEEMSLKGEGMMGSCSTAPLGACNIPVSPLPLALLILLGTLRLFLLK